MALLEKQASRAPSVRRGSSGHGTRMLRHRLAGSLVELSAEYLELRIAGNPTFRIQQRDRKICQNHTQARTRQRMIRPCQSVYLLRFACELAPTHARSTSFSAPTTLSAFSSIPFHGSQLKKRTPFCHSIADAARRGTLCSQSVRRSCDR